MSTLFYIIKWPSRELLIDALKYGDDPVRKFRVDFTVRHHSYELTTVLRDVEVLGFQRILPPQSPGWTKLVLRIREEIEYAGHRYRAEIVYAKIPLRARHLDGDMALTRL